MAKLKVKSIVFDLITFFIFTIKISFSDCNCDLDTPILVNGVCKLQYCTETEYENEFCIIDNDIIKTQWLSNIIRFDDLYRFVSFAINSKGDMIAEFSVEHDTSGKRLFYGLKQEGNYFFKNSDGSEAPTKIVIINDSSDRIDSKNLFISLNNNTEDTNEYLLSVSIYHGNFEIFDFESNINSFVDTKECTGYLIYTSRSQIIKLNDQDEKNKYLFIFVGQRKTDLTYHYFYLVLQIYSFSKKTIGINDGYKIEKFIEKTCFSIRAVGGYTTDTNRIVIFYFNEKKFKIMAFNYTLDKLFDKPLFNNEININGDRSIFLKCISLKGDLGVFAYYLGENETDPQIKLEEINDTGFEEKFSVSINFGEYRFHTEPRLSDLMKINDNRFSYVACSTDKSMLFILLFDLYNNDNNLKMRMYRI